MMDAFVVFQGDHNWEMARSNNKYGDRKENIQFNKD